MPIFEGRWLGAVAGAAVNLPRGLHAEPAVDVHLGMTDQRHSLLDRLGPNENPGAEPR